MQQPELDDLLNEHFPDLTDRGKAREFVRLSGDAREVYLFAAVETINERQAAGAKRMDRIEECIRNLRLKNSPKAHIGQALYTTAALIGVIIAAVLGKVPALPGWMGG